MQNFLDFFDSTLWTIIQIPIYGLIIYFFGLWKKLWSFPKRIEKLASDLDNFKQEVRHNFNVIKDGLQKHNIELSIFFEAKSPLHLKEAGEKIIEDYNIRQYFNGIRINTKGKEEWQVFEECKRWIAKHQELNDLASKLAYQTNDIKGTYLTIFSLALRDMVLTNKSK